MGKKLKRKQENRQVFDKEQGDRAFFEEEYIKRAEAMERELFGDEDPEDEEGTSEDEEAASYEKLVRRLKAEGIYREDEAPAMERKQISGQDSSKVISRSRGIRRCLSRAAIIAVLCCACMFTVSMTSEANRNYLVKGVRYLIGDDTRILTDNNGGNEIPNLEEQDAIKEIESFLEVEVPEFYYRPERFEFLNYKINTSTDTARVEYEHGENVISLFIDKQDEDTASKTIGVKGKKDSFIITTPEGIEIAIEEIKEEQDILPSYTAIWERNKVVYWLVGKVEKQEIIKMFEQMVY